MKRIAEFGPRRSRAGATFDNTYQTLGTAIPSSAVIFKIVNNTNQDLDISTDGVTDHYVVPASSFTLYDIRANHSIDIAFAFPQNMQFFVRGAVAGTGNVYLVIIRERP